MEDLFRERDGGEGQAEIRRARIEPGEEATTVGSTNEATLVRTVRPEFRTEESMTPETGQETDVRRGRDAPKTRVQLYGQQRRYVESHADE